MQKVSTENGATQVVKLHQSDNTRKAYSFSESKRLWQEAQQLIPGGSQGTRSQLYPEWPNYFVRAKGCRAWDIDGNEFIDFLCSIGPVILGYAYDRVDNAVINIIRSSFQSSTNHPVQLELARLLIELIPCAERVRFFKTGTEATMAAVRLARHITGRTNVAHCGYHGWTDMWRRGCDGGGVHKGSWDPILPFNGTAESLVELFKKTTEKFAAVIICPIDTRPFTKENYQGIIDVAHKHGALVIFDEIKSGFRTALGGAQELLGVTPDITTLSKGMGNGYPISAVVGKAECMEAMATTPSVGTFSVEAMGVTASLETLREMKEKNVVEHLWRVGQRFIDGLNQICKIYQIDEMKAEADPVPSVFKFAWNSQLANNYKEPIPNYFFGECLRYGLFLSPWHVGFVNYSHSNKDIDEALDICDFVMAKTKRKF
ncbi:MAG: aspartate aminotransferase family protein [Sedimentisphaerales bacterium]